jgi:hypothetical protein
LPDAIKETNAVADAIDREMYTEHEFPKGVASIVGSYFRGGAVLTPVKCSGILLRHVTDYLIEHKGIQPPAIRKPLVSKNLIDSCRYVWDVDWMAQIPIDVLVKLSKTAHELGIEPLVHLTAAKIGTVLKGEPLERCAQLLQGGGTFK